MESRIDKRVEQAQAIAESLERGDYTKGEDEPESSSEVRPLCGLIPAPPREFDASFDPDRAAAILVSDKKWANGTHLRYCFLQAPPVAADRQVVEDAFAEWKALPLGLDFSRVDDPAEAEIRITFDWTDGSKSTVGRDALMRPAPMATMNFGWQLSGWGYGFDTALHEIGHALGLPHEHQNPVAGIVWDEVAVVANFAGAPNHWDEQTTRFNILRKISPDAVQGSSWDPNSIMHYSFDPGLIVQPPEYLATGLTPAAGLSQRDEDWVKTFYPADPDDGIEQLLPFESQTRELGPGEQVNFLVEPTGTRWYQFATFGSSDAVLVLFEDVTDGPEELRGLRFRTGDDDSGADRNAHFWAKLYQGRRYVLRLRLYWPGETGSTAVMMW